MIRSLIGISAAGMNVTPVSGVSGYSEPDRDDIASNYIGRSIFEGSQMTKEKAQAMADLLVSCATKPGAFEGLKPLVHQMATPGIRNSYLLQRRLPHMEMPILWIWGKAESMEPWPTWTEEWENIGHDPGKSSKPWIAPNAKYHLLEQGTHNALWERPEEIVRLCSEFIEGISG